MIDVTCAIILNENKVLVMQRSEMMTMPLKWEFPGGRVEKEKSEESCLHREIKEELNLEVEILQRLESKCYDYETFTIKLIPFVVKYISGQMKLAEHKDYQWLTSEELRNLDWALADIPVLDEFLKLNYDSTWAL